MTDLWPNSFQLEKVTGHCATPASCWDSPFPKIDPTNTSHYLASPNIQIIEGDLAN